jgi:inosine-uridine nucleoside N-ribohydrolase
MKVSRKFIAAGCGIALVASCGAPTLSAQTVAPDAARPTQATVRIVIDTDIGDDLDDAFAIALALQSPEVQIDGITTAWGDTALRARLVHRLLLEAGRTDIPIAEGIRTQGKGPFTQARWAEAGPPLQQHLQGVDFLLKEIAAHPGEITLVAIGPLTNIGAAIERDAATFRKLKRVVLMGGSIHRRYNDLGYTPDRGPEPEYNILCDVAAAKKLFASGVPIFMMPLDSTQMKLNEVLRGMLFSQRTAVHRTIQGNTEGLWVVTDTLAVLYHEWNQQTPTLFDVMAMAYVIDPNLCPTQPMHIEVADNGLTQETPGTPNASVCLSSDSDQFFHFLMPRLMRAPESPH